MLIDTSLLSPPPISIESRALYQRTAAAKKQISPLRHGRRRLDSIGITARVISLFFLLKIADADRSQAADRLSGFDTPRHRLAHSATLFSAYLMPGVHDCLQLSPICRSLCPQAEVKEPHARMNMRSRDASTLEAMAPPAKIRR